MYTVELLSSAAILAQSRLCFIVLPHPDSFSPLWGFCVTGEEVNMSPRMTNIKFYDSPMGCMIGVLIYPHLFIVIAYLWPCCDMCGKFINTVNPMNIANNKMSRSVTSFTYMLMAPVFLAGFRSLNLSWSIEWCVVYVLEQLGLLLFICGYEAKLIKLEWLWESLQHKRQDWQ